MSDLTVGYIIFFGMIGLFIFSGWLYFKKRIRHPQHATTMMRKYYRDNTSKPYYQTKKKLPYSPKDLKDEEE